MLELCMTTCHYNELSPEEAVKRFVKKDWRYMELSSEHGGTLLERGNPETSGREFLRFLKDTGAFIPQGHLWLKCDIAVTNQDEVIDSLKKWIDLYLAAGIKNAVLHAGGRELLENGCEVERIDELRLKGFTEIADHIKGTDMVICIENTNVLRDADGIIDLIKRVGSDRLGICLDTGHQNRFGGSQAEFIHKAKPYLKALHINDNEGVHDQHMMPYGKGTVDWNEVVTALKEINYQGVFNLEIPGEKRCPFSVRDAKLDYLKTVLTLMLEGVTE